MPNTVVIRYEKNDHPNYSNMSGFIVLFGLEKTYGIMKSNCNSALAKPTTKTCA